MSLPTGQSKVEEAEPEEIPIIPAWGPAPHSEGHSHTFVDWNPADKAVERALDAAKKGFRGQATEFLEQAYGAFADAAEQETPESEPLAGDNEQEMPVAHVDDAASGGEQQIVANGGDVPPTAQQIEADGAPVAHGGQDPSATAPFAPSGEELQIGEIEPAGADEEAVTA